MARSSTRTDELLARLAGRGRLVVVGPGGSGKSELLEALVYTSVAPCFDRLPGP